MTADLFVPGRDVHVGDVLATCGAPFTVTALADYPSPYGPARTATATDGRQMTVFDDYPVRVREHH